MSQTRFQHDTLGLMLGLQVSPASIRGRDMIAPLLSVVAKHVPSLVRAMANAGYQGVATATGERKPSGIEEWAGGCGNPSVLDRS